VRALFKAEVAAAVGTLIAMHFLSLVDRIWIIDNPKMGKRLSLTAAGAFGAATGCALILVMDL